MIFFLSGVTLKFDGWSWKSKGHLFYITSSKPSFQSHGCRQTGATVRKRSIRVKIGIFSPCDLEIWQMTLKNNRALIHLSYAASSFVRHFVAIDEFKLELGSGNTQSGSRSTSFLAAWRMTLKNNRQPVLSNIKLCTSFRCHMSIQTGVTVRKPLSGVMTCNLDLSPPTFCMPVTSVNGYISWKFQDDTMRGTLSKRCEGRTDRRKKVFLKMLGLS